MIQIEFSETEIEQLEKERWQHPDPRVQRRFHALYYKALGYPHQEIEALVGVSAKTLRTFFRLYQVGGMAELKTLHYPQPVSALAVHQTTLEQEFCERPAKSVKEAVERIKEKTGVERSRFQVSRFLKQIGMSRLKVGQIPDKADLDQQEAFLKKKLTPLIEQAQAGRQHLLFMDAAHFVLQPFLGYLWCFVRVFIQASSGRQRFNVLAVLDACTHQLITVTNDAYINANSVCTLLRKIRDAYTDELPITIILDNARYQHCRLVIAYAKTLDIELLFLPPYSPNLNLIERMWRFVRKTTLASQYFNTFASFKAAIQECLNLSQTKYKAELQSLLVLKFQTFNNVT